MLPNRFQSWHLLQTFFICLRCLWFGTGRQFCPLLSVGHSLIFLLAVFILPSIVCPCGFIWWHISCCLSILTMNPKPACRLIPSYGFYLCPFARRLDPLFFLDFCEIGQMCFLFLLDSVIRFQTEFFRSDEKIADDYR